MTPDEPTLGSMSGPSPEGTPPPGLQDPPPPKFIERVKQRLRSLGPWSKSQIEKAGPRVRYWIARLQSRIEHLQSTPLGQRLLGARKIPNLTTLQPAAVLGWAQGALKQQNAALYGTAFTLIACSYFLADISALVAGKFIPDAPPARINRAAGPTRRIRGLDDYQVIFSRNLFNSEGRIPGEEAPDGESGGTPIRTTLPFNLIGTLLMRDEQRSIATIEDKSASVVYPLRIQDEIPGKAKILQIEPNKVIFLNMTSRRREFIDIPEGDQPRVGFNVPVRTSPSSGAVGIERASPTQFNIARSEVDRALSDLNNILTQARAVPNFENGAPAGYKLFQIVPGSIYDKLGLQNGDVIAGLNGSPVNDPGKAFEMLTELKTANHLELQIKRDGKSTGFTYDIR